MHCQQHPLQHPVETQYTGGAPRPPRHPNPSMKGPQRPKSVPIARAAPMRPGVVNKSYNRVMNNNEEEDQQQVRTVTQYY